jgi:hypothetical protein
MRLVTAKFSKQEQDEMECDWEAAASILDGSVTQKSAPTCTSKGLPCSALGRPAFLRKSGLSALADLRLQGMTANTDLRIHTWQEDVTTRDWGWMAT